MEKKIWPPDNPAALFRKWETKHIDIRIVRQLLDDWYGRNILTFPKMDEADAIVQAGLLLGQLGSGNFAIMLQPEFYDKVEASLDEMPRYDGAGNMIFTTSFGQITLIKQRLG